MSAFSDDLLFLRNSTDMDIDLDVDFDLGNYSTTDSPSSPWHLHPDTPLASPHGLSPPSLDDTSDLPFFCPTPDPTTASDSTSASNYFWDPSAPWETPPSTTTSMSRSKLKRSATGDFASSLSRSSPSPRDWDSHDAAAATGQWPLPSPPANAIPSPSPLHQQASPQPPLTQPPQPEAKGADLELVCGELSERSMLVLEDVSPDTVNRIMTVLFRSKGKVKMKLFSQE